MQIPLAKLRAILLYFCQNTDQAFLGKVKLMKLFYFLDFTHVKRFGVPVTFDRYVNLEHGPVPILIHGLVNSLEEDFDSALLNDTIAINVADGQRIHRVAQRRDLRQSDLDLLSPRELETLEQVCARFGKSDTAFIKKVSHLEAPWSKTVPSQEIPYSLAAQDEDSQYTKEEIELMLEALS